MSLESHRTIEPLKRVAPRVATPAPSSGATPLPDDVLAEQVHRLSVLALVAGGLWAIGLVMEAIVTPFALGTNVNLKGVFVNVSGAVGAIGTYAWVRFSPGPVSGKTDAGMWLMVLNAAAITLAETWASTPIVPVIGYPSWTAVVILISAMIAPSTPRKMLIAAFVSASLGPIGIWLAHLSGVETPGVLTTLLMYMPNYSCAAAAAVPAQMFQRMGRRLREARDLGSYELEARLGEGGMGEVWRARHRLLARPAAIKLIRPAMLGASEASDTRRVLSRFASEAKATATLTSPHTVRLFDYGMTDDGRFYYVMELLDGLDMATLVQESGPLPAGRVLFLVKQVCHSLSEAHAKGLVHRDIKPANIFVCRMGLDDDVVKVLDFGLVQETHRGGGDDLTASLATLASLEGVVGTPAFMAPESLTGHAPVDHRADLYAVGCVTYFLLTGEHVFHGRTPLQSLMDHVTTPPPRPSTRTANAIPAWLDDLVMTCLAKSPDDRPQSAQEIAQRMALLEGTPTWTPAMARNWWSSRHAGTPMP